MSKAPLSLKATTLRTLLEPDGNLPPVLPRGTYEHNKSEKTIRVAGGGTLFYFGIGDADDYTKIGSLNLSGCAIDEAVELREEDWTMLRGRVRLDVGGLPMQIYGACNPGPPSHFLAKRFGLAGGYEAAKNCESFTTKSLDNVFLPQAYVEDLLTLTGTAKARYVLGAWVDPTVSSTTTSTGRSISSNDRRATSAVRSSGKTRDTRTPRAFSSFLRTATVGFTLRANGTNGTNWRATLYTPRRSCSRSSRSSRSSLTRPPRSCGRRCTRRTCQSPPRTTTSSAGSNRCNNGSQSRRTDGLASRSIRCARTSSGSWRPMSG